MNQKKHGGFAHFKNSRKIKNPFQKCHYERKKIYMFLKVICLQKCQNKITKLQLLIAKNS